MTKPGSVKTAFATDDPTYEISATWACKELQRQLLAAHGQLLAARGPIRESRHETGHRQPRFLAACVTADMPETTHLAGTVERWWPEIQGFLRLGILNAFTEGCNRVITQIKRVACGICNQDDYDRRMLLHSAILWAA